MRLLAFALLLAAPTASAQFAPDRPGFGTGTGIVPTGRVQLEAGLPEAALFGPGQRNLTVETPLQLRVGVLRGIEVSVAATPLAFSQAPGSAGEDGWEGSADYRFDLTTFSLGAKATLLDGPVAVTLLPSLDLSTDDGVTGGGLLATSEADLSDALSLGLTGGVAYADDAWGVPLALTLGYGLSDRADAYAELATPTSALDGTDDLWAGTGLTFLARPTVQLDVFVQKRLAGTGLNAGGGVAVLF